MAFQITAGLPRRRAAGSCWRPAPALRPCGDAAGVARADGGLAISVGLAVARYFSRVCGRLRQEGRGDDRRPAEARRARGGLRGADLSNAGRGACRHSRWRSRRLRHLVPQAQGRFAVRQPAAVRLGRARLAGVVLLTAAARRCTASSSTTSSSSTWSACCIFRCRRSRSAGSRRRSSSAGRLQGHRATAPKGLAADVFKELGASVTVLAERRDRAGHGPRPARRRRTQQSELRLAARPARRGEVLHDGQPSPAGGRLRDRLQQGASTTRCRRRSSRSCATPRSRHRPTSSAWPTPAIRRTSTRSGSAASTSSAPATRCFARSSRPGTR